MLICIMFWHATIQNTKLHPRLKIMVSPVRIRVPPLLKYLQIRKKERASVAIPTLLDNSAITACQENASSKVSVAASCIPSVAWVWMARVTLISEWPSIF
jgi:hypothetical protein